MLCPYCKNHFHENWQQHALNNESVNSTLKIDKAIRLTHTSCCKNYIVQYISIFERQNGILNQKANASWIQIDPIGANRGPVSVHVPEHIKNDYIEACNVLPISPKASAALSRRCVQNILHNQGYKGRDLNTEIDLLLSEPNTSKAIPIALRTTIDGIRAFGNFSAHPITDKTTLQVIDVEPEEAEWCLEILEGLFEHFYVQPALALEKKAKLDAKLAAAGKPPSK